MSRTVTYEDAQKASHEFDFKTEAVEHYNSHRFAEKHGIVNQIASYADLSDVPPHLAVAALQHAASQEQGLLLQKLGVEYITPIFEGIVNHKSRDTASEATTIQESTAISPSIGSLQSNNSENDTAVASARHVAQINYKLRKLQGKADNLINHPCQHAGEDIGGALDKVFERITELSAMADPEKSTVMVEHKVTQHVKREILAVFVKLYTHIPTLAINEECGNHVRNMINEQQKLVTEVTVKKWKNFVHDYRQIIKTKGSGDQRVKKEMEQLAAAKKAGTPTNGAATVTIAHPTGTSGIAAVPTAPIDADAATFNPLAPMYIPTENINGNATGHNDSGFVDDN